jgi:ribosomal protein S18 acetylase RimI-like enzyme
VTEGVEIRRAVPADIPVLAGVLMRAFLDDPVASWAYRPERLRPRALERFQAIRLRQLIAQEEVWTTADLSCAALWAPPGHWHSTLLETAQLLPSFGHPRLLARVPLMAAGWERLERVHHPRQPPHFYLAVLGTDPSAQGRGLGSAVLRGVFDQCDNDGAGAHLESSHEDHPNQHAGMPCYLESSKESNISFYERFGFEVLEEIKLLRGPPMWKMWRDPPARSSTVFPGRA